MYLFQNPRRQFYNIQLAGSGVQLDILTGKLSQYKDICFNAFIANIRFY